MSMPTFPTIEIDGTTYTVKLGLGAMYALEQMGLTPTELPAKMGQMMEGGEYFSLILKLGSAMLGTLNKKGTWKHAGIRPEELAEMIAPDWTLLSGEGFPPLFSLLAEVVTVAMGKVQPAPGPAAAPALTQ